MLIVYYLLLINILSAFVFFVDKQNAIKKRQRIPELTLHILEILGGVFSILIMIYFIHHKNYKFSYYLITYSILILYIFVFFKFEVLSKFIDLLPK
ncbi:MAG: DUF1294 domain-containing protein [Bacteroidales bacterium]